MIYMGHKSIKTRFKRHTGQYEKTHKEDLQRLKESEVEDEN